MAVIPYVLTNTHNNKFQAEKMHNDNWRQYL